MVELRKRKTPPPAPEKAAKRKPGPKSKAAKAKEAVTDAVNTAAAKADKTVKKVEESATNGASSTATKPAGKPEVGATLELDGFGGEIETNDGTKTTLKKLVDESKDGVVLFTYPKASTPGCTKQACLFRDSYTPLTATGLSIFGLSSDSPKANTTFKTKQNLPYPLLCDPSFGLIRAIGLAKPANAKGTVRGVFVIDKSGKVLAAEAGGPDATVEVVKKIVAGKSGGDDAKADEKEKQAEDKKQAETAGEVADAAAEAGVDGEGK